MGLDINLGMRFGYTKVSQTFATLYSTTFLLVKSDLLPTRSLSTPSEAYRSISWSHCFTLEKVSKRWSEMDVGCRRGWRLTAISDIVDHDDTVSTTVVRGRNGPESFLTYGGRHVPFTSFFRYTIHYLRCPTDDDKKQEKEVRNPGRREDKTRGRDSRFGV